MSLCYRDEAEIPPHVPAPGPIIGGCAACLECAQWVKRVGLDWRCWTCWAPLLAPIEEPRAKGPPDCWRALDRLARFAPDIEGSAIPLVAPLHYDNKHASSTTGRTWAFAGSGAEFEKKIDHAIEPAGPLSSHAHRRADDGRHDRIDAHSDEFGEAIDALHRLDAMVQQGYERSALVLLYAGVYLGPVARDFWWSADESRVALPRLTAREARDPDSEPVGLDWRVGVVFADASHRFAWLWNGKLGRGFARLYGRTLLEDAVRDWNATIVPPDASRGRVSLASARDVLGRFSRDADAHIALVLRPMAVERRKKANLRKREAEALAARAEAA